MEIKFHKERIKMDEMRIKLSTSFMRGIVSKLIARSIYKKYGYKVNIKLEDLDVWVIDGDTTVKLNVEAKPKSEDFKRIMKTIDQD